MSAYQLTFSIAGIFVPAILTALTRRVAEPQPESASQAERVLEADGI